MKTALRFLESLVDVILLGKCTPIPTPVLMLVGANKITTWLKTAFPGGIPYVDLGQQSFALALIAIIFPPLVWNIIGSVEYYTHAFSGLVRKPIIGVYLSGAVIATLSVFRSALFIAAMRDQPVMKDLDTPVCNAIGGATFVVGLVFFIGAYYQLGITGTYLGDYFGIFREERITAFPFNALDNPMYDGSSMFHLAEAILNHKPGGMLLAVWLFLCYRMGCIFEEPFTEKLYAERDRNRDLTIHKKFDDLSPTKSVKDDDH